jgi:hypothetical protein
MFPQQPQQQFRTAGADVQMFYTSSNWTKPPGVSHVYMMLIGPGGAGIATTGGGSGAVTVWYGAAQHVPDNLMVVLDTPRSEVYFYNGIGLNTLFEADGGTGINGGIASPINAFSASGFYKSTAGQDGSVSLITPSPTTFLSGGADSTTDTVTANYGYSVSGNGSGFFQMQPIIVGAGGSATGRGGIGCGGGADSVGGPGLVLIASW